MKSSSVAFVLALAAGALSVAHGAFDAESYSALSFEIVSDRPGGGRFEWAADAKSGRAKFGFRYPGDGRPHRYCLPLSALRQWKGSVGWTNLVVEADVRVSGMELVTDKSNCPADVVIESAQVETPLCRAGGKAELAVLVRNCGGAEAADVRLKVGELPSCCRLLKADAPAEGCRLKVYEQRRFAVLLACDRPGRHEIRLQVEGSGLSGSEAVARVLVLPAVKLPRADYVPEPRPVKTDYDLAAFYYPGWVDEKTWRKIADCCPERKPVLGWYDEANPEVVDWQIKWLVENGIRTLYVDWYWCRGKIILEHWLNALSKARYRSFIKWAVMWANHDPKDSHSVEDQRAVTRYWINRYFKQPEYLKIDGKPVVWLWQAENLERDVGPGGCRRLLDLSRRMAVEAGYPGIHFIAMKWPENDCSAEASRRYQDMGFDRTGIYHFKSSRGRCASRVRFPYSAVAEANPMHWIEQRKTAVIPFLPNLSTGWDDRPWRRTCEIYGKTAADFRRICEAAKRYADATGERQLCLAALNEWGEGSYAEPNAEHGFGFYEAVREVFCEKPAGGWPVNFGPADVGLGPYELISEHKQSHERKDAEK